MNILILSWRGPGHPLAGGAERVTQQHAKAWVASGHAVTLFTSRFTNSLEEEEIDGIHIIRRGNDVFGVQIQAALWYFLTKHARFDVVIDEFHGIPFFTPLYVRTRIVAFIHEVAQNVWSSNPWPKPFNLIPWFVGKLGEPYVFKLLYRNIPFMTVSASTKKDLELFGIKTITVIHNGLTLGQSKKSVGKEKQFTLLFLSALAKDKGVEDAIKIFNRLNDLHDDYQFWIVGKGDEAYSETLKSSANKNIKFWGYVSEEIKVELLTRAHLLVNPSIHEGWGLVNIEANACGTPVVGFKVPGMVDSVVDGKTGMLIPLHDIDLAVQKIREVKSTSKMYEELRKNAIEWSKQFSWDKAGAKSLKLISNL